MRLDKWNEEAPMSPSRATGLTGEGFLAGGEDMNRREMKQYQLFARGAKKAMLAVVRPEFLAQKCRGK